MTDKIELTAAETRILMGALYGSALEGADDLHDKLAGSGLSRLNESKAALLDVEE